MATTAVSALVPIEQHQSGTGHSDGHDVASGVGEGSIQPRQQSVAAGGLVPPGEDQQILKQHELALQRLEQLQGDMIGGEKGGG